MKCEYCGTHGNESKCVMCGAPMPREVVREQTWMERAYSMGISPAEVLREMLAIQGSWTQGERKLNA